MTGVHHAQQALIVGVMQTWKAYNYMMLAETRDTNGVALWGTNLPTGRVRADAVQQGCVGGHCGVAGLG